MSERQPPISKSIDLAQALQRAVGFHQQGRLADAQQIYTDILRAKPGHGDASHMLGVIKYQQGEAAEALRLIGIALRSKPKSPEVLAHRGLALAALGRYQEASASYSKALAIRPNYFEALYNRGNALQSLNRHADALASFDKALAIRPAHFDALHNRGNALQSLNRHEDALASFDRALAVRPDQVDALNHRGNALHAMNRSGEALASYDRALAVRPDYFEALYNRGNTLQALNRHEDALASYDRALAITPDHVTALINRGNALSKLDRYQDALESFARAEAIEPGRADLDNNRGNVLQMLNRHEEALACYDRALAREPYYIDALYNRGNALQSLTRCEEALTSYDKALAIRPDYVEALYNRGTTLHLMNRLEESLACFDRALAIAPACAEALITRCMAQLPVIYASEPEIAQRRKAYREALTALRASVDGNSAPGDLARSIGANQPFFLPYQGYNDRELQSVYGDLVCRIMADRYPPVDLASSPRPDEPVRVGIVSGYFWNHSNWKIPIRGWLSQLDRGQFRVFGYHTGKKQDAETQVAARLCERFVQAPLSIDRWRRAIMDDAPHILVYPEVGMDPMSVQLAAQRLAPVQCTSWGHPETSGFPTLDYYLSSALMEPPDAEDHYSERLVRLPNLSIYYEPVDSAPASLAREDLDLRRTATVYWCGQSLFKYLPQYDHVFPRIAREAGDCQFAFIEHSSSAAVTDVFRKRLQHAFAAHGLRATDHCVIMRRLDQHQFMAAIGLCDIILDSIGWSGCNSTLEALPHDLPIVTMAGPLMRGRHSMAILEMMGVTSTITATVDDYVAAAVRLARDHAWRSAVGSDMAARKDCVYRDRSCVVALEAFFNRVARAEKLPTSGAR